MTDTTRRVLTGAGWLYGHRWIERLLDFAAVVVVARMLSPDDFGLVAIAASVVAIVEGLGAFGIEGMAAADVAQRLMEEHRIFTVVRQLGTESIVRVTPHLYTRVEDVDALAAAIVRLAAART